VKEIFKKIIISILTIESKMVLWRFRPKIIAITGNVGKTSAKDSIYSALKNSVHIRKNQKSFNSEIGTPLTILGLQNAWSSPSLWLLNIIKGFFVLFTFKYPKWLVLEIGVDRPGDIERVAKWIKPNVVVITSLPKIPVHVEYFESPEDVIKEKKKLIKYLRPDGVLILNADDELVLASKHEAKTKVMTFGTKPDADVFVSNQHTIYEEFDGQKNPTGISIKVNADGNSVPVALPGVLGVQHMYPVVAAIAVGLSIDVPFLEMTDSLMHHRPPRGRMNIVDGINKSIIIDDTYNSSPLAVEKALDALEELELESEKEKGGKKIAVLGDMLEIGRFTVKEHKNIGKIVADKKIDILFAVGLRSEDIAKSAVENGMAEEDVFYFKDYVGVAEKLKEFIKPGFVVLVKGSQGIRLEKVVAEIMRNPEQKKKLLIRQEKAWENR